VKSRESKICTLTPSDNVQVIENSHEARDAAGHAYGSELQSVSREQIVALLAGKCLCFYPQGEYSLFVVLEPEK
jgi:hypothetical protein